MPKDYDLNKPFSIPTGSTRIDHFFGEFVKLTAVIDYYFTVLILFHLFGLDAIQEQGGVVNDFSKWFLSKNQESLTFAKKVDLVDDIINNSKYNNLDEKYRAILNASYLRNLVKHRNLLINSHYVLSQQQEEDDSIKLIIFDDETKGTNHTKELDLSLHRARVKQAKVTRKELINLARDLGIIG